MVSYESLSLILSIVAIVIALLSLPVAIIGWFNGRRRVERQAPQGWPKQQAPEQGGAPPSFNPGNQPVPSRFRTVPDPPPQAVAPALKSPPRPTGGFGAKVDATQIPADGEESTGGREGSSS